MEEPVINYTSQDFCLVKKSDNIKTALKKMISNNFTEAYVLDRENCFLGKLLINDLIEGDGSEIVLEHMMTSPLILAPDLSVLQSIEACRTFVGESIPIVEPESQLFKGIISEADLFSAYLDLDKQIKDLENG
jgi:CIC family chloride channel protein